MGVPSRVFVAGRNTRIVSERTAKSMPGRVPRPRRALACALSSVTVYACLVVAAPPAHAQTIREQQWYLDSWKIEEVWRTSQGAGISVAVVDTGVDATHPDLVGQVAEAPLGEGDASGHGTQVASVIVGTGVSVGGEGVHGVAPKAKVLSFRIPGVTSAELIEKENSAAAIRAAADSRAQIINVSLGGNWASRIQAEAINYAFSKGKLVVASGGNINANGPGVVYPAAFPGVLGVGAVSPDGRTWTGGNTGQWISLAAPGVDIPAACTSSTRYCIGTGSSTAAALVSGVAALVWSANPTWTANQVIKRLIENTSTAPGEQVPNDLVGFGIVSPRRALQATGPPGPPDVNPLTAVRGVPPTFAPTVFPQAPTSPRAPTAAPTTADPTSPAAPTASAGEAAASPPPQGGSAAKGGGTGPGTVFAVVGAVVGGLLAVLVMAHLYMRSRRGHGALSR